MRHAPRPFPGPLGSAFADRVAALLLRTIAALSVALLAGIFLFLAGNAFGLIGKVPLQEFFLGSRWNPGAYGEARWGILPLLTGTFFVSAGAMAFAVPFGLALAIYLSEVAPPRRRELLKPAVEMIAGIPSVVLGLLGLLYLAPLVAKVFHLSNGLSALTASLLVGLSAVPTIASLAEDALTAVPVNLRHASLALGSTQWTAIWKTVLPAARTGVVAAVMLGLGRAIGETIVVLMVAGNSLAFPHSLLDPVRPMTATIAIEIREVVVGDAHWHALFAVGFVLFVLTFLLNSLSDALVARHHRH